MVLLFRMSYKSFSERNFSTQYDLILENKKSLTTKLSKKVT